MTPITIVNKFCVMHRHHRQRSYGRRKKKTEREQKKLKRHGPASGLLGTGRREMRLLRAAQIWMTATRKAMKALTKIMTIGEQGKRGTVPRMVIGMDTDITINCTKPTDGMHIVLTSPHMRLRLVGHLSTLLPTSSLQPRDRPRVMLHLAGRKRDHPLYPFRHLRSYPQRHCNTLLPQPQTLLGQVTPTVAFPVVLVQQSVPNTSLSNSKGTTINSSPNKAFNQR